MSQDQPYGKHGKVSKRSVVDEVKGKRSCELGECDRPLRSLFIYTVGADTVMMGEANALTASVCL